MGGPGSGRKARSAGQQVTTAGTGAKVTIPRRPVGMAERGRREWPNIWAAGLWERPQNAAEWHVPRAQVKDALRACCKRWNVLEIAWDPYLWLDAAEELLDEGLPVVEFPQNQSRMAPATQRFYELVTTKGLTHSGDPRLARHVANTVLKSDSRGSRIVKESPHSPRKIDLAIGAVMALDRAAFWPANKPVDLMDTIW